MMKSEVDQSRRGFVKKVAYAAPIIATLSVMPSVASAGSVREQHGDYNRKFGKFKKPEKRFQPRLFARQNFRRGHGN